MSFKMFHFLCLLLYLGVRLKKRVSHLGLYWANRKPLLALQGLSHFAVGRHCECNVWIMPALRRCLSYTHFQSLNSGQERRERESEKTNKCDRGGGGGGGGGRREVMSAKLLMLFLIRDGEANGTWNKPSLSAYRGGVTHAHLPSESWALQWFRGTAVHFQCGE